MSEAVGIRLVMGASKPEKLADVVSFDFFVCKGFTC